jgi:D-serine deaminase-like pyridoxal phosphate-dependent protein
MAPTDLPWLDPTDYWPNLDDATASLDPPFAVLHGDALAFNAQDMVRRAAGKPIRVASKSIRARGVIESVLKLPGYAGVLAYTLPEALWLADSIDDIVVGYPSAAHRAYAHLATDERLAARVTVMVDSPDQLDLIDDAIAPDRRVAAIRVCIELDAAYRSRVLGHVGVWRSPVRDADEAVALAREVVRRPGYTLVGLMAYEAQIAGVGDAPAGKPVRARALRRVLAASMAELIERRTAVVAAVREIAPLAFVNGGGTGSIERTAADPSITEIAAGSGLYGPHLFDHYSQFHPAPAAAFALPVVRRPAPDKATLLGGGWIASGPPGEDRLPVVAWPQGLSFVPREGAGEVQTPVVGDPARRLRVGDRVWLRHTKAGELSEHVNELHIVDDGHVVESTPTYRGEGKAFA